VEIRICAVAEGRYEMNAAAKNKPASLGAGLVKKGAAVAGVGPAATSAQAGSLAAEGATGAVGSDATPGAGATAAKVYAKALTVKLDSQRYMRLKLLGLERGKSSQQLLVEALDALLERAAQ
jgi:hypothetical protein